MAESATIARPYAEAVYRLACEQHSLSDWSQWLTRLAQSVDQPELRSLLGHPALSPDRLVEMLLSLIDGASPSFAQFVRTLIDNDRLALSSSISDQFEQLKRQGEGVELATIETAFPLDAEQLAALTPKLEAHFATRILPSVCQNANLLGGIRVTVGDRVYDASVKGKLEAMAFALKN